LFQDIDQHRTLRVDTENEAAGGGAMEKLGLKLGDYSNNML
jgi:hypothetical protein